MDDAGMSNDNGGQLSGRDCKVRCVYRGQRLSAFRLALAALRCFRCAATATCSFVPSRRRIMAKKRIRSPSSTSSAATKRARRHEVHSCALGNGGDDSGSSSSSGDDSRALANSHHQSNGTPSLQQQAGSARSSTAPCDTDQQSSTHASAPIARRDIDDHQTHPQQNSTRTTTTTTTTTTITTSSSPSSSSTCSTPPPTQGTSVSTAVMYYNMCMCPTKACILLCGPHQCLGTMQLTCCMVHATVANTRSAGKRKIRAKSDYCPEEYMSDEEIVALFLDESDDEFEAATTDSE
jgi:hypothetical protein